MGKAVYSFDINVGDSSVSTGKALLRDLKLGRTTADMRYYQLTRTKLQVVETDEDLSRAVGVDKRRS